MATFIGTVALALRDGFIEVVRADQVAKESPTYDATDGASIASIAIAHAKARKVLIKAYVPTVEPAKRGTKGETYFKPETLEELAETPVILKARKAPLPYLAFLSGKAPERVSKPIGLGPIAAKPAKPAKPKGL